MNTTDCGIIVKTVHELLTTYEVTDKHYCINERSNPLSEIFNAIRNELQKYTEWRDVEYFSKEDGLTLFPLKGRIKVFFVTGGSEGYYVHVEVGRESVFLLKCWSRHTAEAMVLIISRILEV
jgi:hypothetical protein